MSLGMIGMLTIVNICLIVYSYKVNIKAVYFISLTMQISFICCNLKTSHHASTPENYIVVRNACSARLILMALQTSHLTSMAVQTEWAKYAIVNIINITMFTILIFLEFRIDIAGFWEMGQLGSIYSSAIVSLIMYHYLSEQLNKENIDEKNVLSEQRDSFQLIVDSIQEGIIIVQDGKIEYMNTIFNNIMSQVYEIKNFFKESFRKSIIDEFDLLDIKVF